MNNPIVKGHNIILSSYNDQIKQLNHYLKTLPIDTLSYILAMDEHGSYNNTIEELCSNTQILHDIIFDTLDRSIDIYKKEAFNE